MDVRIGVTQAPRELSDDEPDDEPRTGAGGCRIAFLHPKSAAGILIGLTE